MPYRLFITHAPLPKGMTEPNYSTMIAEEVASKEDAIEAAMTAMNKGHVVWRVEGPESFLMEREVLRQMFYDTYRSLPRV